MSEEFIPPTSFPARYRLRGRGTATLVAFSRGRYAGHLGDSLLFDDWHEDGSAACHGKACDLIGAPLTEEVEG